MGSAVETRPAPSAIPTPADDMWHVWCRCTPGVGLCGYRATGHAETSPLSAGDVDCVVCTEMDRGPCPRCGR